MGCSCGCKKPNKQNKRSYEEVIEELKNTKIEKYSKNDK